jgi:cell division inhibitor SepF
MASMWRKAMLYLGLGPDEEYDDFDVTGEHARPSAPRPVVRHGGDAQHDPEPSGSVRTLTPAPVDDDHAGNGHTANGGSGAASRGDRGDRGEGGARSGGEGRSSVRRLPAVERPSRAHGGVVRPLPGGGSSKPVVVGPTSFNDAQEVADRFKGNVPVILNLQGVERDLARRIIDFASGLCYGLGGQMERVANHVYLLTPSDVEVSPEERRRLHERGYEA